MGIKTGVDTMTVAKKVKMLLIEENANLTVLANRMDTSQPNLSNKMKRDNFCEKEIAKIAEVMNVEYEINFILKDGRRI